MLPWYTSFDVEKMVTPVGLSMIEARPVLLRPEANDVALVCAKVSRKDWGRVKKLSKSQPLRNPSQKREMDKPIKSVDYSPVIGDISLHDRHAVSKTRVKLKRLGCGVVVLSLSFTSRAVPISR